MTSHCGLLPVADATWFVFDSYSSTPPRWPHAAHILYSYDSTESIHIVCGIRRGVKPGWDEREKIQEGKDPKNAEDHRRCPLGAVQPRRLVCPGRPARRAGSLPGVAHVQGAGRQAGRARWPFIGREGGEKAVRMCLRLGEVVPAEVRRRGLDRAVPPPAHDEIQADVRPARGMQRSIRCRSNEHSDRPRRRNDDVLGPVQQSRDEIWPVRINESDFEDGELDGFYPGYSIWEYLLAQRTERWNDSDVHCCCCVFSTGVLQWYDWMTHDPHHNGRMIDGFQEGAPFGLLLDLDKGTLTMYQNGRTGTLKDGLSGEYCWFASCAGALPYHPAAARNDAFATICEESVKAEVHRFLEKGSDGLWHEVIRNRARKKASQALREYQGQEELCEKRKHHS
ncbi:hypothetical protein THAOC_35594 [Thalassiosira oceanica]|uniref:DUF6824 domain-containing protein n=1 Tax=Thalassiosira oceanica TaxID=159749 RepID=K0R350_THAOC|nr:hypothetical protein THAOC_35594 [Thalassiosira oceanica]|eukprot:EJK45774.1 hypothetical protein THAOC_35594 [Thalassiosira oceanica]